MTGVGELVLVGLRAFLFEKGFVLRSRQFVWMIPLSDLLLFGAMGAGWGLAVHAGARISGRLVLAVNLAFAMLALTLVIPGVHLVTCVLVAAGISYRGSRWLADRSAGFERVTARTLPSLVFSLVILALAPTTIEIASRRWRSASKPAPPFSPNVLLVVLDTVRADHLSLHGYARNTTPNLKRFAERGVVFHRARAAAPWTLPSHASLFTGRWPHELGVEERGWLDRARPTLAEHLRDRGYATAGFVGNTFFCGRESGLARGFEAYHDFPVTLGTIVRSSSLGWLISRKIERMREELLWALAPARPVRVSLDFDRKPAATVRREFTDWLDTHEPRPFFAFLNFFDAHDPYLPPAPPAHPFGETPRTRRESMILRDWGMLARAAPALEFLELARDSYDDCLAALDAELGQLFRELDLRGLLNRTLVIITADHGEQFYEHGGIGHGLSLYRSEVHVPLVISLPGRVPGSTHVHEPVSLRDVAQTVMEMAGSGGEARFPGCSLSRFWGGEGGTMNADGGVLSELHAQVEHGHERRSPGVAHGSARAIAAGRYVYHLREHDGEALYDLEADPDETRDLSRLPEHRARLEEYRRKLAARLGDS